MRKMSFAIPQSAKQTGAICAQKLVQISTCFSDVLRRDARQPPQLALGFVNHSACAKFTYLYLWIYLAHGTNSQYCMLMKALHRTCLMDSGCYFVHFPLIQLPLCLVSTSACTFHASLEQIRPFGCLEKMLRRKPSQHSDSWKTSGTQSWGCAAAWISVISSVTPILMG